ncbi:hypothetical protein Scep_004515 [Stephania cephalantha]|uniref:Uncharacterized protein n=1 Tax=Stephania cephalantha TaxID=152367 RepID=A0AAP0KSL8_9MAGN
MLVNSKRENDDMDAFVCHYLRRKTAVADCVTPISFKKASSAAYARLKNTREEREHFDEASTQIIAHLKTKSFVLNMYAGNPATACHSYNYGQFEDLYYYNVNRVGMSYNGHQFPNMHSFVQQVEVCEICEDYSHSTYNCSYYPKYENLH